ncbi:flagellar assembly protein FlgT [uncultured Paraglaciecola sp.]|uniref:flagellar assembly protein FlgT n=1 Tax=uncultured Paraglaciecola sp. TaxID=1765024 RepID=UPI0025EF7251|nr:flagellar assembly protein FlgT [uncultured Paraglaciecola sp.]
MQVAKIILISAVLMLLVSSRPVMAIWFEATGQAVIHNGEKEAARQQATQEAIKQALLFSGASVKSIQSLANGLLEDDRFEIRASGEVNNIELIDEIYHDDFVTVSIRADIFPQEALCAASDYKKNIVTTWYNINKRQQAAVGNLYDFGKVLANKLKEESQNHARHSIIHRVEPYYLTPLDTEKKATAFNLAKKTEAQYVLFGEILEFAVETPKTSGLAFWKSDQSERNLTLAFSMYDGNSGEMVFQTTQNMSAQWNFDLHASLDSNSRQLWDSTFGSETEKLIQSVIQSIDESVSCLPAYGRVLKVTGESLSINIGKHNGVKQGDKLTLFQVNQFFDAQNFPHRQFQLHPEAVVVRQVFAETAVVESLTGAPLANIQPNDFVARR